ncbi:uncharacterized protein LOC143585686 [Bidens hawaiensis]|uniref:uncharacterized protein LOC143585686 n=1 Tax=Bidens hawaiensis TaxID=980011 RepID=UPI0040492043
MVADRLFMLDEWICGNWDWSREPVGIAEVEELRGLLQLCQGVSLRPGEDKVVWTGDEFGGFSVRNIKEKIYQNAYSEPEFVFEWKRLVLRKVSFVAWRVALGRLPTRDALIKRNIPVSSIFCPTDLCFRDLLELHKFLKLSKDKANVFQAICLIAVWCLWKKRNALVHDGVPIYLSGLMEEIKVLGFLWVKNRGKMKSITWENWCRFKV